MTLVQAERAWLRPHPALQVPPCAQEGQQRYYQRTPTIVLGLTDHSWIWEKFLARPIHPH